MVPSSAIPFSPFGADGRAPSAVTVSARSVAQPPDNSSPIGTGTGIQGHGMSPHSNGRKQMRLGQSSGEVAVAIRSNSSTTVDTDRCRGTPLQLDATPEASGMKDHGRAPSRSRALIQS